MTNHRHFAALMLVLFCMTVFLAKLTGVVCHCLPLVLPAVPVRSPFREGKGTNGLHHAKVGTEDFGSSAQVVSKIPIPTLLNTPTVQPTPAPHKPPHTPYTSQ